MIKVTKPDDFNKNRIKYEKINGFETILLKKIECSPKHTITHDQG